MVISLRILTADLHFFCLQYGRHAIGDIAKEVEGKTEAEVSKYSKKFWKRYHELNDSERVIKNIERGEQRIQRQQDIMNALAAKLERYRNPWQELRLQYGANKGKVYTGDQFSQQLFSLLELCTLTLLIHRFLNAVSSLYVSCSLHRQES